eukprot:COSAG05_NODE_4443_length_1512_cov_5.246285_1_plen_37_part_00
MILLLINENECFFFYYFGYMSIVIESGERGILREYY